MRKRKASTNSDESFAQIKQDEFNFDLIGAYHRSKDNSNEFQVLSDKTCNDLDLDEVFIFADRTSSKIGQQYLYNKIRTIPEDHSHTDRNETIISKFSSDRNLRLKVHNLLKKLNKTEAYYISSLFQAEHIKPPKWFFIIRLLAFTSILTLILMPFNSQFFFVFLPVVIANLVFHYQNKRNLYQYLGSIPQLLKLNSIATKLSKEKAFQDVNPDIDKSIKAIKKVKNRMSLFQLEARMQGELEAIIWMMIEMIKIVFLIEPLLLYGILNRLNSKRTEIEDVYRFVGEIDSLLSIAMMRKGLETFCAPTVIEETTQLSADKIYHPLISECITNNIDLKGKSVLLTGSNMSGKTSFIRTIGINMITGLTLNTCFAESVSFPKLRFYSAIRISDDLLNDKSYYFEEVLTIKEMIDKSSNGKPNLFLLDEIFKGTNTIERISAGKAVLSSLANRNNIVFVSTHDIELTEMLSDQYELYHFSEIVTDNKVDFDYKLKEGKLTNRNAIRILQLNNYPESVVNEALEISGKLDKKAMQI